MSFFTIGAAAGFILLHSSQCKPKNTTSIIIANLLSIAIGTIMFWATGYAFAIGDGTTSHSNFFLSYRRFFLIDATDAEYKMFSSETSVLFMVMVLCNSGFVCRLRNWLYPILSVFIAGFLYPCARHWAVHIEGWLKDGIEINRNNEKENIIYSEKNGAGSIHVFAGSIALLGTILLAPRKERKGKFFTPINGEIRPLMLVGGTLAFLGLLQANSSSFENVGLTCNLLAAQGSALVAYILKRTGACGNKSGTKALINGALIGLVALSGFENNYHAYAAFAIGVVAGVVYVLWSTIFQLCHLDDPTDAISVHLGGGIWAMLAGPIFHRNKGLIYSGTTKSFEIFGWHLLGALAIFVWAGLTIFMIMIPFVITGLNKYHEIDLGLLPSVIIVAFMSLIAAHEQGLDAFEFKEPAFPPDNHYTQEDHLHNVTSIDEALGISETKGYTNSLYVGNYRQKISRNEDRLVQLDYPERSWQAQARY